MIQGYAIYLRTHRETGKQYAGCVWGTKPNWTAEKACASRWRVEDCKGISGLFGGFDSEIILSERRKDAPEMSDGLYRIRIAVDETKIIDAIPMALRLNLVSPLVQSQIGLMRDVTLGLGGRLQGPIQGRKNAESGQIQALGRIQGPKNAENGRRLGHIQGRKMAENGQLASIRALPQTKDAQRIVGQKNVASGHLAQISSKGGRSSAHQRQHVKRGVVSQTCEICMEKSDG